MLEQKTIEFDCLELGTDLGQGGRALNPTNSAYCLEALLKNNWALQTSIIVVASKTTGKAFVVDGNHRVHALMQITDEQRKTALSGTTIPCVMYEGVPANLLAILALHVNEEGLRGSATTILHKLMLGLKACLQLSTGQEEVITAAALIKAVNWSSAQSTKFNLGKYDVILVTKLAKRFGRSDLTSVLNTLTFFGTEFPSAVRRDICKLAKELTATNLNWNILDRERKGTSKPENEAVEERTTGDDFLPASNMLITVIWPSMVNATSSTVTQRNRWTRTSSSYFTCSCTGSSMGGSPLHGP